MTMKWRVIKKSFWQHQMLGLLPRREESRPSSQRGLLILQIGALRNNIELRK